MRVPGYTLHRDVGVVVGVRCDTGAVVNIRVEAQSVNRLFLCGFLLGFVHKLRFEFVFKTLFHYFF